MRVQSLDELMSQGCEPTCEMDLNALDVQMALERLEESDRELVLRYAECQSITIVAREFNMTVKECRQRIKNALEQLREWLK